jgi:hypothetical protein
MAKVERACIEKNRPLPEWLTRAFDQPRAEIHKIECPVERRCKEIELDLQKDKIETELLEAH